MRGKNRNRTIRPAIPARRGFHPAPGTGPARNRDRRSKTIMNRGNVDRLLPGAGLLLPAGKHRFAGPPASAATLAAR